MREIKITIMQKLKETEEKYSVKIPLAIESGSRGWEFASPDSDYDCRFVYVNQKDWYLSVFDKKDFIEYTADKIFDINGWDLRKFILHIVKSNAVMFEWISSNVVYIHDEKIKSIFKQLADAYFNPVSVSYHYLNLAKKKYNEIIKVNEDNNAKLKKYFYVLRPLANIQFIEQYNKMSYMEYFKTLSEIEINANVKTEIMNIVEIKKTADESYKIPQNIILTDYFKSEITRQEKRLKTVTFEKNRNYEQVDDLFREIIELAWG